MLRVYIFMDYIGQHAGATYSGHVVSLMMGYFYSVGCYLKAYQQQSNYEEGFHESIVDSSHSSLLPREYFILYMN